MSNTGKALMALSFLAIGGCYTYVPVNGEPPPSGKEVRAHIRPARDFGVGQIIVRDVTRIEGIMYIHTPDTIAVWSNWFHTAMGTRFLGSNAVVYIPRAEIPQLEVRKLHPVRTVGAVGVGVLLGAGFLNLLANPVAERGTGRDPSIDARVTLPFGGR